MTQNTTTGIRMKPAFALLAFLPTAAFAHHENAATSALSLPSFALAGLLVMSLAAAFYAARGRRASQA